MADTQTIKCIKCNKILGTLNALTGEMRGITYNKALPKLEKVIAKGEAVLTKDTLTAKSEPVSVVKRTMTKAGYRVSDKVKVNLDEKKTVTCSCGQVNGIY